MSTSAVRSRQSTESELRNLKRKTHEIIQQHLVKGIKDRAAERYPLDSRPPKTQRQDADTSRPETWRKMDDAIVASAGRSLKPTERKDSCSIRTNQNAHCVPYFSEHEEKEMSSWKRREPGRAGESKGNPKHRKFQVPTRDLNLSLKVLPPFRRKLRNGDEEGKPLKFLPKRNRDENSRGLLEPKRRKNEESLERRSFLNSCISGRKDRKPAFVKEAELDYEHERKGEDLNQAAKIVTQGGNPVQCGDETHHGDALPKHKQKQRKTSNLNHRPGSSRDISSRPKEKLGISQPDDSPTHPELTVSELKMSRTVSHQDGTHSREPKTEDKRRRKIEQNPVRNTNVHDRATVMNNAWEFRNRFRSKVVVLEAEPEEIPRPGLPREDDQEEQNSDTRTEVGQEDRSQEGTDPDNTIKNGLSTTRELSKHLRVEERVEPAHGSRDGLMNLYSPKLDFKTKVTSIREPKGSEKSSPKLPELKGPETRRKVSHTKDGSHLGRKTESRRAMEFKAQHSIRRSKGRILRKSPEMLPSEEFKVKEDRNCNKLELKRRTANVGGKRDDSYAHKRFSSDEPDLQQHRHRGRFHSLSPNGKKLESQNKEHHHRKSLSPRGTEKGDSNWEAFERERHKENKTLAAFDSRYRRFGGGTSGLGGYSPRRRRSEAAIKTPSPPPRSPDRRKPRAWDLPPPGIDSSMVAAISAAHQAVLVQQASIQQAAAALASVAGSGVMFPSHAAPMAAPMAAPASCGFIPAPAPSSMVPSLLQQVNPAVIAVSLTQGTRPLRRLYVGNVPATVSDGELLEFMNAAMLSANANYLAGTKPCINCSVNVEKSYAFAEFITPEDATAALAFDGVTLHGTTLKIRRPKDFTPPANGGGAHASLILDLVSSTVPDSPRKVFVGGISSTLSAEKVREIVTAFGQLKAYHWEVDRSRKPPEAYAFLEYMDPEVTLRACAGLNGMKLGTRFLTVVQATPDASPEITSKSTPFYGVPARAKLLLRPASRILELQNLVTDEEMRVMTEQEINEMREDIRLECTRFGNVKSMHIVPSHQATSGPGKQTENPSSNKYSSADPNATIPIRSEVEIPAAIEPAGVDSSITMNFTLEGSDPRSPLSSVQIADTCGEDGKTLVEHLARCDVSSASETQADNSSSDADPKIEKLQTNGCSPSESAGGVNNDPSTNLCKEESMEASSRDLGGLDVGRVYVEFSREESACQAAHNLHGRTFSGRMVTASYFPVKKYQKKFQKDFAAAPSFKEKERTFEVEPHLTSQIR
ncbi:hypothetical protein R1sor_001741 [Riccia sorocarpa]|uniref:RRM domain-containing protein n=1 Tax=Riccia sorocarpa TaxID=122646 RepID=A0ABD3H2Q5_9MARC